MANSWVLSSWVRLVLSSLFCHCRVQKFSQWFHFKGWVSSHMSSKQNYGKLFAGKIGMKYYPVIYGDIYIIGHESRIPEPEPISIAWEPCHVRVLFTLLTQCENLWSICSLLMVVHPFAFEYVVWFLLTLTFGWSVVIPCCVELATCHMVNYQLEVNSWTRLNCNMSL